MRILRAEHALTAQGWRRDVAVSIGEDGRIAGISDDAAAGATRVGVLLPAPVNLHSHAFQRAMAGLTERRGEDPSDNFWTWRKLMFRFLDQLSPDDVEAIAAFVQMEMLEAGYSTVAEFHYLHHQPGGAPYDDLAELARRICAAARETGIGLTLLPVLYQQGGCDGRPLTAGQIRFGNDPERFARLYRLCEQEVGGLAPDCTIGVAPHSLRAISREGLDAAVALAPGKPLHMHVAEQVAEVEEVEAAWGRRPVEWLFDNYGVDRRWCFIHATQMQPHETEMLAASGAVAGLCPITESSLGDGIFDARRYLAHRGHFGIGSDSNIRISLAEELRTLEYSQRLRDRARAVLATPEKSTGRVMLDGVTAGGARAGGRDSGTIEPGKWADLVALDADALDLAGRDGDTLIDSFIFAGDSSMVRDVWAAGRHVVTGGRHRRHDAIVARYRAAIASLKERL
ncbi:MAG: formimidoylglutamate deiminase [Flavobacteriaceae bacterium]